MNTTTRNRDWHSRRDQGFSLIELLVVVIIVGILAGIAIPVYLNQRKKAVDASLKADLKNASLSAMTIVDDPGANTIFSDGILWTFADDRDPPGGWSMPGWGRTEAVDVFEVVSLKGSPGNWLGVSGRPRGTQWTLCAYNPGASRANARTNGMVYDPAAGGLQANLADCSTGYQRIWPRNW